MNWQRRCRLPIRNTKGNWKSWHSRWAMLRNKRKKFKDSRLQVSLNLTNKKRSSIRKLNSLRKPLKIQANVRKSSLLSWEIQKEISSIRTRNRPSNWRNRLRTRPRSWRKWKSKFMTGRTKTRRWNCKWKISKTTLWAKLRTWRRPFKSHRSKSRSWPGNMRHWRNNLLKKSKPSK